MRLKAANRLQQQQQQLEQTQQDLSVSLSSASLNRAASMNEDSRYDIMNGSNSSTGSASAIDGGNDDLEQDSGDVSYSIRIFLLLVILSA